MRRGWCRGPLVCLLQLLGSGGAIVYLIARKAKFLVRILEPAEPVSIAVKPRSRNLKKYQPPLRQIPRSPCDAPRCSLASKSDSPAILQRISALVAFKRVSWVGSPENAWPTIGLSPFGQWAIKIPPRMSLVDISPSNSIISSFLRCSITSNSVTNPKCASGNDFK